MKMTRAEKIILALCGIGGLLFAFALKAFGDDILICTNRAYQAYTFPAGDGVNEVTQVVDGDGHIVWTSTTLAHVPQKRVIDDMECIVITPSMWCDLTNTVERLKDLSAQRWKNEHKTVAGREAWHGKATNRVISAASVTWLYADGYTYTETEENAKRARNVHKAPHFAAGARNPAAPAKKPSPTLPPRLAEKREAEKSRAGKAREVNAVFGPGGKVLKVEEVK